tara:strand:+ start:2058 stop:3938 length:1881 start_codon:yes stop_codon:yes gene_type:complete
MAISVKLLRTGSAASANTFVVTAGAGDTGKLQIQYNSGDIYNNLSGASVNISSGASAITIEIPLDATTKEIPSGVYYFNFVASVGSSDTSTINFQAPARAALLESEADIYAPSFRVDDSTTYTLSNGTVSAATRSLTLQYPAGSSQGNLSAAATDTTTALYISTANVWTGSMQTTLAYDVTYTIAATTGYATFTYQESGTGYDSQEIEPDNALTDLYECIEAQRVKVANAASKKRSNYQDLLSDYTYSLSLATQYREAVNVGNTGALNAIIAQIKYNLSCNGASATASSEASRKVYGLSGAIDSSEVQTIVGAMFDDATNYGVDATYDVTSKTISLAGRALYLNFYNDTGASIAKGKAVYATGYSTAQGLPTLSLASNASSASAEAIGLVTTAVASATSGRAVIYGNLDLIDTSSFSVGDRLFLSTTGDLTATVPASSANSQFIGTVLESSAEGRILVSPEHFTNYDATVASAASVVTLSADVSTLSGTTTQLGLNFVEVSSTSVSTGTLNATPIQLIAPPASGVSIMIHGAMVVNSIPTSGTPTGLTRLQIFRNTAATYDAGTVTHQSELATSASAKGVTSQMENSFTAFNYGDGAYIGTATNASADGWDNEVTILLFYTTITTA